MVSKINAIRLIAKAQGTRNEIRCMIMDILKQLGAENEDTAIVFDAEINQAPSFLSINCSADADGTDVYVKKLWLTNAGLQGDYYLPCAQLEENAYEYGISLDDETCVDYEDILDWLKEKIE